MCATCVCVCLLGLPSAVALGCKLWHMGQETSGGPGPPCSQHNQPDPNVCLASSISLSVCLALCVLPLKLLMWQIHKIKRKSSHNEHFLLPYLRYFIIIFLRCRHSQCVCVYKMAALLYLSDMSCHKLTQTHTCV